MKHRLWLLLHVLFLCMMLTIVYILTIVISKFQSVKLHDHAILSDFRPWGTKNSSPKDYKCCKDSFHFHVLITAITELESKHIYTFLFSKYSKHMVNDSLDDRIHLNRNFESVCRCVFLPGLLTYTMFYTDVCRLSLPLWKQTSAQFMITVKCNQHSCTHACTMIVWDTTFLCTFAM